MTLNQKKALAERVNDSIDMMLDANSIDEITSAYIRAIDALANLNLGLIKERVKEAHQNGSDPQ